VIAVDTNLLVYAHRAGCPEHEAAQRAIEAAANDSYGWGIPSPCLFEFWSVVTHPSSIGGGTAPATARHFIDALIETAGASILPPPPSVAPRSLQIAEQLDIRGPRIFDLQIGLVALDAGVTEIWTHDAGFVGLPGLTIRDPLEAGRKPRTTRRPGAPRPATRR
jgi:predicted nucleic acid-binding protein